MHIFSSTFNTNDVLQYNIICGELYCKEHISSIGIPKVMCIHTYCKFYTWHLCGACSYLYIYTLCLQFFNGSKFHSRILFKIPLQGHFLIQSRLQCNKQEERLNQIKVLLGFLPPYIQNSSPLNFRNRIYSNCIISDQTDG
jgi:hypothetical protein